MCATCLDLKTVSIDNLYFRSQKQKENLIDERYKRNAASKPAAASLLRPVVLDFHGRLFIMQERGCVDYFASRESCAIAERFDVPHAEERTGSS